MSKEKKRNRFFAETKSASCCRCFCSLYSIIATKNRKSLWNCQMSNCIFVFFVFNSIDNSVLTNWPFPRSSIPFVGYTENSSGMYRRMLNQKAAKKLLWKVWLTVGFITILSIGHRWSPILLTVQQKEGKKKFFFLDKKMLLLFFPCFFKNFLLILFVFFFFYLFVSIKGWRHYPKLRKKSFFFSLERKDKKKEFCFVKNQTTVN